MVFNDSRKKRFKVQISVVIPDEIDLFLQRKVKDKRSGGLYITKSDLIREALLQYCIEDTDNEFNGTELRNTERETS